jgi:hypothetical protein
MNEVITSIAENIGIDVEKLSLDTPQWGPYHNEGNSLESHVLLMIKVLDDCLAKIWHKDVPENAITLLQKIVAKRKDLVEQHIILHDVGKGQCMTFKYADGHKEVIKASTWGKIRDGKSVADYPEIMNKKRVRQISYMQIFPNGKMRTHPYKAVKMLREYNLNHLMIKGIETHEIASQFGSRDGVNISLFEKVFGNYSEEEILYILLVNYIDKMACIRKNGQPDMSAFLALLKSWQAWKKFVEVECYFSSLTAGIDQKKLVWLLGGLRKNAKAFTDENVRAVIARFLEQINRLD